MKKLLTAALVSAAIISFTQCSSGYSPPMGSLYQSTTLNKDVSTQTNVGNKSGKACATGYLGLVSLGDASVKAAAAQGNVGTIHSVDYSNENILGSLVAKTCTIVNGN